MSEPNTNKLAERYRIDGFVSPVKLIGEHQALAHRKRMEEAENSIGNLHYKSKIHTLLTSPYELATLPNALDLVEQLIGPDILLYNVTYIVKEPNTNAHVSWHQDLTYWGLSDDDQVSMWLALSPATHESGCMKMLPGSQLTGPLAHQTTEDKDNVLLQGQTVTGIDTRNAVECDLRPGEASFHHGWTLHASMPNSSNDRRIGLNVQYLAPHIRQTKHDLDTAMLVRGVDKYKHFVNDVAASTDLEPTAIIKQQELEARYEAIVGSEN